MKTLDEAWRWYSDVKKTLRRMHRVGERYWDAIPWGEPPWRGDKHFDALTKEDVTGPATNGLRYLDDQAILVLFSIFEAVVRGTILDQIEREDSPEFHRIIRHAIETAKERVSEGSFFAVLEPLKGLDDHLVEEVNQVRRYRNWVAHGRRNDPPAFVSPDVAYDRLGRFLDQFFPSPEIDEEWLEMMRQSSE